MWPRWVSFLMMLPWPIFVADEARRLQLVAYDAVTVPGRETLLCARATRKRGPVRLEAGGAALQFYVGAAFAGSAVTGGSGRAAIGRVFARSGCYEFTVASTGTAAAQVASCKATVFCAPRETPAIVVDIDHTVADDDLLTFLVKPNRQISPVRDAPEVLRQLSERYEIIFVTHREDAFHRKTKQWLAMNDFPPAPVFFWEFLQDPLGSSAYKTKKLRELQEVRANIRWGIGDKEGDIRAYQANGITPLRIGKVSKVDNGVRYVTGWLEIRDIILEKAVSR